LRNQGFSAFLRRKNRVNFQNKRNAIFTDCQDLNPQQLNI